MHSSSQIMRSGLQNNRADPYLMRNASLVTGDRTRSTPPVHYNEKAPRGSQETMDFSFFPYPRVLSEEPSVLVSKSTLPSTSRRASSRVDSLPPQPMNISNHAAPLIIDNEDFSSYSWEQLAERLRLERLEKLELKRLLALLRENNEGKSHRVSHTIEEMSRELVGLREQNYRLKNIANDELVMLQKVETKEVYGKKSKVQEELEAARNLKEDYDRLSAVLKGKENAVQMLENELQRLRNVSMQTHTVIDPRFLDAMRENSSLKGLLDQMRGENAALRSENAAGKHPRIVVDNRQLRELEQRLTDVKEDNNSLRSELARKADVQRNLEALQKELQGVKTAAQQVETQKVAEHKREVERLMIQLDQMHEIERKNADLVAEVGALKLSRQKIETSRLLEAVHEVGMLQGEIKLQFVELERLRPLEQRVVVLSNDLVQVNEIRRALEETNLEQKRMMVGLCEQIERGAKELEELPPLRTEVQVLNDELNTQSAEKRLLEERIAELQDQIASLKAEAAQLRFALDQTKEEERRRAQLLEGKGQSDAELINDLQRQITVLTVELQRSAKKFGRLSEMESHNSALTSEITLLGQTLKRQEDGLRGLEELKHQLEARCGKLQDFEQKYLRLEEEFRLYRTERAQEEREKIALLQQEIFTLKENLAESSGLVSALEKENNALSFVRAQAEKGNADLQRELKFLRDELEEKKDLSRQLAEVRKEGAALRNERNALLAEIERLRTEGVRQKTESEGNIERFKEDARANQVFIHKETLQINELRGQNVRLKHEIERLNDLSKVNAELQKELNLMQELKAQMDREFHRLRTEIELTAQEARRGAEAHERAACFQHQLANAQEEIARLKKELEKLPAAEQQISNLQAQLNELKDKLSTKSKLEAELKAAKDVLQAQVEAGEGRNQIQLHIIALKDEVKRIQELASELLREKLDAEDKLKSGNGEPKILKNKIKDYKKLEKHLQSMLLDRIQQLERALAETMPNFSSSLMTIKEELRENLRNVLKNLGSLHLGESFEGGSASITQFTENLKAQNEQLRAEKKRLVGIISCLLELFGLLPSEIEAMLNELQRAQSIEAALNAIQLWDLLGKFHARSAPPERPSKILNEDTSLNDTRFNPKNADLNENLLKENKKLIRENERLKAKLNNLKEKQKETQNLLDCAQQNQGNNSSNLQDLHKLRDENVLLATKLETHREDLKMKKKILLNELINFVNSKNNFENSCYTELTRYSLNP